VRNSFAAQIARLTESGAFAGANANPSRNTAILPEVVGPLVGKDPVAKLNVAARQTSSAVKNNFRNSILTIALNSADVVPAFSQIRRVRQAQSLTEAPRGVWFGGQGTAAERA
jgi:hypothetical protein